MAIRQRGVALVTILLLLAVLATLAIYAAEEQDLSIRRVSNLVTAEQGFEINLSGEQWVVKVLEADIDNDNVNASGNQPVVDHPGEIWGNLGPPVEVGETGMSLWMLVEDQQSRININNLVQGSDPAILSGDGNQEGEGAGADGGDAEPGQVNEGEVVVESDPEPEDEEEEGRVLWYQVMRNLLVGLEINPELADPLMDWVDADGNPTGTTGAEDFHYTGLDLPYRAPNRPMASPAELAMVRDFSPRIVARLLPWVSALPVGDAGDLVAVNVNTAPARVLAAFAVDQPMDPSALEGLVQRRALTPFESVADFADEFESQVPGGLLPGYEDMLSVSSLYFAGRSCAQSGKVKFSMTSLLHKQTGANNVKVLQRERFFGCPLFPEPEAGGQ